MEIIKLLLQKFVNFPNVEDPELSVATEWCAALMKDYENFDLWSDKYESVFARR